MVSRTYTAVLALVAMMFPSTCAEKAWMSLPLIGPSYLVDDFSKRFYYAPIWIGNPPQVQHLAISLYSLPMYLFDTKCFFCPGNNTYDSLMSSSFEPVNSETWPWSAPNFQAQVVADDISVEGIATSRSQEFGLVNRFTQRLGFRFTEGLLGLAIKPSNRTISRYSLLDNLHKSGQLLNPVIGMNLGGDDPRLTIGALDPNDYEGEINWVERVEGASIQTVIPVEAVRGRADRILPFSYPLNAMLSTVDQEIHLPNNSPYFLNESHIGPQSVIYVYGDPPGYGVECNITEKNRNFDEVHIPFSVDINGVNYPVDSKELVRPQGYFSSNASCRVGLLNSSTVEDEPVTLGITFMRSIYLAYRFPTEDCPYGHYGFAFRRGANRTSATIHQKPRTTPLHASQCLQLVVPASTPSSRQVKFAVKHRNEQFNLGASETTYKVWGKLDEAQTPLRGVDDLPEMIVGPKKTSLKWW